MILSISGTQYGGWGEPTRVEKIEDTDNFKNEVLVTEKDFTEDDGTVKTVVSMCFFLKNGRKMYKQLDKNSTLTVGQKVDIQDVKFNFYEKDGVEIMRCDA